MNAELCCPRCGGTDFHSFRYDIDWSPLQGSYDMCDKCHLCYGPRRSATKSWYHYGHVVDWDLMKWNPFDPDPADFAIKELNTRCSTDDVEANHITADHIIETFLDNIGYTDVADAYAVVKKWYA